MTKKQREQLFQKYGGRCAYCGCELQKGWHADHITPCWRGTSEAEAIRDGLTLGTNEIDNFNPSCARCNNWKMTYTVDQFRNEIAMQLQRLTKSSPGFRLAMDYGVVAPGPTPVRFYFEKYNHQLPTS